MPANDFSSILGLSRVSAGEYWAIGIYQALFTQSTELNGSTVGASYANVVLLHFANGIWTQYGR